MKTLLSSKRLSALLLAIAGIAASGANARTLIQNKGSDTMAIAVQAWADAYRRVRPDVGIAVNAGGSGTGIAALINGTVDIANTSRAMTRREIQQARSRGREPVRYVVGYDAVAVFVHPDNPLQTLNRGQIARIFGRGGDVSHWNDLDVRVPGCYDQRIVRVGRQNSSGTFVYFRHELLGKTRYKTNTLAMRGTRQVVDLIENTPCAIGYGSVAYATDKVKVLCLAMDEAGACVTPSADSVVDGSYVLARPLFMYTGNAASESVAGYIHWVLSDAGQCIERRRGYAPVRAPRCEN